MTFELGNVHEKNTELEEVALAFRFSDCTVCGQTKKFCHQYSVTFCMSTHNIDCTLCNDTLDDLHHCIVQCICPFECTLSSSGLVLDPRRSKQKRRLLYLCRVSYKISHY